MIVKMEDLWHFHIFPPRIYLKAAYLIAIGRKLDLQNPRSFTEKIQWMKLYDKNPVYTQLSDKLKVKSYITKKVGSKYIVPTLGYWKNPEDIILEELPNRFIIKCTHDCGSTRIFDKLKDDSNELNIYLHTRLRKNYYYETREWGYKNVPPRIIAEPILYDQKGKLWDYKFFCFDGKVKFFKIDIDRFENHRANYYDPTGTYLDFGELNYPRDPEREITIPQKLHKMIEIAEILSSSFKFLRVDMYYIDGDIKVGELTLYPGSGLLRYDPQEWDYRIGEYLRVSEHQV